MAGNVEFTIELKDGDDVIEKLKEFAQNNGIEYATFMEAEGKLKNFEISEMRGAGRIENAVIENSHEVVSVSGRIYRQSKAHVVELKLSLARSGTKGIKGLLIKGLVEDELNLKVRLTDAKKIIIG